MMFLNIDDPLEITRLKIRLGNLTHFLLTTPPSHLRAEADDEMRQIWADWDLLECIDNAPDAGVEK